MLKEEEEILEIKIIIIREIWKKKEKINIIF